MIEPISEDDIKTWTEVQVPEDGKFTYTNPPTNFPEPHTIDLKFAEPPPNPYVSVPENLISQKAERKDKAHPNNPEKFEFNVDT